MSTVTSATSSKVYTVTTECCAGPQRKSDGKKSWGNYMRYSLSDSLVKTKATALVLQKRMICLGRIRLAV